MNRALQAKWPWIEGAHAMRTQLLESLSDADLAFNPGGANVPLGQVLRELGEVESSYVQSLKTFTQEWSKHPQGTDIETSLSQLSSWYQSLDEEMHAALEALSDDDLGRTIAPRGFAVELQIDVYLQALLIFYGKLSIYFRAMNRALSPIFLEYIG